MLRYSAQPRQQRGKRKGVIARYSILMLALLAATLSIKPVHAQASAQQCEDVIIMPHELTKTFTKDDANLLDVHVFHKFFTYQVPATHPNIVETKLTKTADSKQDLVMRLRASLKSPGMDHASQTMKVTVVEESTGHVVVQGSSSDHDERNVHLDSIDMQSSKDYLIRYEFYEKNEGLGELHERTVSSAHMGASACSHPHVVMELAVVSKQLIDDRAKDYLRGSRGDVEVYERDFKELPRVCDFATMNNTSADLRHGEDGLYCARTHFKYDLVGQTPNDLNTIFEERFQINGAEGQSVTYLFDFTLGFEFAVSAQIKAILRRIDHDQGEAVYDPLRCLYDHSCVETELLNKNELGISVILTPGKYELIIFDQQENELRKWLTHEVGLRSVPFTFELTASPVVQNEERVMCRNQVFLSENFIQNRFIDGRQGQRFTFADDVIVGLVENVQKIRIKPEETMYIKMRVTERDGINTKMSICDLKECFESSSKIGINEYLFGKVEKGKEYFIEMDFYNSIIQMQSFYECPWIQLDLAMVKVADANKFFEAHAAKSSSWISKESQATDTQLRQIADMISRAAGGQIVKNDRPCTVLVYNFDKYTIDQAQSWVVTQMDFTVPEGESRQMALEVFYDSQFYDLELLVESRDVDEQTSGKAHRWSQKSKAPVTNFKGQKKLLAQMEPGDYTFMIIGKLPGTDVKIDLRYIEFQLYFASAVSLPDQAKNSRELNFYGLLGPTGEHFGQMVHYISSIKIAPQEEIDFEFTIAGVKSDVPHMDVQALEYDGQQGSIALSLAELDSTENNENKQLVFQRTAAGTPVLHPHSTKYFDATEDGIEYESLNTDDIKHNVHYRIRLQNRDPTNTATFTAKIIITERADNSHVYFATIPRDFDEVKRLKPKVAGIKESAFIQGSKHVMETFHVTSLKPFIPKSNKVYQAQFNSGAGSDDSFMKPLHFDVLDESAQIFAQVSEYSGREDLFVTIMQDFGEYREEVARSTLGKHVNVLGPITLTKGHYNLVVHPDQDSHLLTKSNYLIKFGLDVLFEQSSAKEGGVSFGGIDLIVEEIELCSVPTLPNNFNGAGYIHQLSGNSVQTAGKYRIAELLQGASLKFDLPEASLVHFYLELPEGIGAETQIVRVKGTYAREFDSNRLNHQDESFLMRDGQFEHRGLVQFREFLEAGSYMIKLQGFEINGANERIQPRCDAYHIDFKVLPLVEHRKGYALDEICMDTHFLPEKMLFDEVKSSTMKYHASQSVVDVAYVNLQGDGEGPFIFYFQIQYDPRMSGVIAVSLSEYDNENTKFRQNSLWRTPQDGVTELMAVVDAGTFAIGIQTLTSSKEMFVTEGLSGQNRELYKNNFLKETCLHVKTSYLITPAKKGGVKVMQGGPFGLLGMLFGGGMGKMVQHMSDDAKLLDEIGDIDLIEACIHDELEHFPISENGFKYQKTLLVQQKPHDIIDLVIEQESFFRVNLESPNTKNQVRVFLYLNMDEKDPIAWSHGGGSTSSLFILLKPQERAYRLKIEYETLDMEDPCPIFYLKAQVKSTFITTNENLRCHGHGIPPGHIKIEKDDYISYSHYSLGSDYIFKTFSKHQSEPLEYDVIIGWPFADPQTKYYMDIETESNFLTGQMTFSLLYEDTDKALEVLGHSHPIQTENPSHFVQRLKLLDREGDLTHNTDINFDRAVLRLKYPATALEMLHTLKDAGLIEHNHELCLNFQLWVRAEKYDSDTGPIHSHEGNARLMRVRWEGFEVDEGIFDPRHPLTAVLEFDRSMKGAYQLLKTSNWVSMKPEYKHGNETDRAAPDSVIPPVKKLSHEDSSTVLLEFSAGQLARGWCHKLNIQSSHGFGLLHPDFDEELLKDELIACSSNCLCNWNGASSCNEGSGTCECTEPYEGHDCSQCKQGHTKDPETGECVKVHMCKELGGEEDCNGHGTCEQIGNIAMCQCKEGFVHDGLDQCGRCEDRLFAYPNCQKRQFILNEPDTNCRNLAYDLPTLLYHNSSVKYSSKEEQPVQGPDGIIRWSWKARLEEDGNEDSFRHEHSFKFFVPITSTFRLFLTNEGSSAAVKYRLLSGSNDEILSSADFGDEADQDGFIAQASEMTVLHQPEGVDAMDAPFTLQLEYKKIPSSFMEGCPLIDIHMGLEPFKTAQSGLKCSQDELDKASKDREMSFSFGRNTKFVNEQYVLRSDDTTLFKHDAVETSSFALLHYKISVDQGDNALSVLATYGFHKMALQMTLTEELTGDIIQLESTSSLLGAPKPEGHLHNDMATAIQIPRLAAGNYELEIAVQRSMFLPTQEYPTCLAFNLVLEYVARDRHHGQDDEGMYEILSVAPLTMEELLPTDDAVIEVTFDKPLVLDDLVNGLADRHYICSLVDKHNRDTIIHPRDVSEAGESTLRLHFDFSRTSPAPYGSCFSLSCSTEHSKGHELLRPMQVETSYCFETKEEFQHDSVAHCNPFAEPKLGPKGKCICAQPYLGDNCEKCDRGFTEAKHAHESGSEHTRCMVDHDHLTKEVCNSHGKPKVTRITHIGEVTCDCDKGYGGQYCDFCKDPSEAYPDCNGDLSSKIYDQEGNHQFLSRRRYNTHGYSTSALQHFRNDALEPSVFNEECGWVDFPDDLDRIEIAREFEDGEFHIADMYVANHRQDNLIKFKPRNTGVFKFLAQQPEMIESSFAGLDGAYDLEVGLYDPEKEKFVASSMNRHLELATGQKVKMEYAALTFEVTEENLNKHFYLFFRALNFTGDPDSETEGCLSLYLEIEFRSRPVECKHDDNRETKEIEVLKDQSQASVIAEAAKDIRHTVHSITSPRNTFYAYQDYYVPSSGREDDEGEWEITISLQQKFIEANTLDVMVEILATDIEHEDIRHGSYSPDVAPSKQLSEGLEGRSFDGAGYEEQEGRQGPSCKDVCLIGGEKGYNEMLRILALDPRTYFRVWLFQQIPPHQDAERNWCANYQLLVSSKQSKPKDDEAIDQALRCHHDELPSTLNTPRYLIGQDGAQKDFHYRQNFRVDHLWHNQAHRIHFTLSEPSLVRFNAPIHRHLEFELVLSQERGHYHHETLVRAKHEDHHSSFFAQLEAGDYNVKLAFAADAGFLQLPCQTVQIEMAINTLETARQRHSLISESLAHHGPKELTLGELLVSSHEGAKTMYRPGAISTRHVEAGQRTPIEQKDLYVEVIRQGFRVTEDDDAGIVIDMENDFLLSGVNFAISNIATGQIVEDLRQESSSRLVVGHLVPGPYELIVYGHQCLTNTHDGMREFDLVLHMSVRLLRLTNRQSLEARPVVNVKVEEDFNGHGHHPDLVDGQEPQSSPLVLSHEELECQRRYLPLPSKLEAQEVSGILDVSEEFYIPTTFFYTHHITFTAKKEQDALRVLLVKSNTKIALVEDDSSHKLILQSKPVENGDAQLLEAESLKPGTKYTIILEFTAQEGSLDGQAFEKCNHFVLALKTWDSRTICSDKEHDDAYSMTTVPNAETATYKAALGPKSIKKQLEIKERGNVDLEVTVDNSGSFFRAELYLRSATIREEDVEGSEEKQAYLVEAEDEIPAHTDFSKKHATTYFFRDIPGGNYVVKLRQRFKREQGCSSSAVLYVRSWHAGSNSIQQSRQSFGGLNLFQSQAEVQERPRLAPQLPLNLGTYKYMGGEYQSIKEAGAAAGYLLFSGPVQMDELESQNRINFKVDHNNTVLRVYAEHTGVVFSITDTSFDHPKTIGTGSGSGLYKKLDLGSYQIQVSHASGHLRSKASVLAPKMQLTVLVATPEVHEWYNQTWTQQVEECEEGANFPLALRQEKQGDVHQLYYDYPLIKVSPQHMRMQTVLQNYNFRINVTSRMYFEVGMHMLSSQVTVQLTTLNEKGFSIQGKQRGNLNILDAQISPGDYTVTLKQPLSSGNHFMSECGIFSLQGLVEPINMMSASANSGDILQRGISSQCEQAADGDFLPAKIYGSKQLTRGGGELHVDASGHFMRRFRNVLFKKTAESEMAPEYDRMEIGVIEDSFLHLSFLHDEDDEIRVTLTDTWLMGQEVKAQAAYKVPQVGDDSVEANKLFKLAKGKHYSLMVYYVSSGESDEGCSTYDLTMSISHIPDIVHATRCPDHDNQVPGMLTELPKEITDRDLDREGVYSLEKMVRLTYPSDFKHLERIHSGHQIMEVLEHETLIKLTHNFDLEAHVEFEFDQALFTIDFTEISPDEETGELTAWIANQQSPLMFKDNNDHFKSVKRVIAGDDVMADPKIERHLLTFTNRQPDILHSISNPNENSEGCLYANIKIYIKSAKAAGNQLYETAEHQKSSVAPVIVSCRPDETPTFLHGRPDSVSYDIIFNKRPFLKDLERENQEVQSLWEAIKLSAFSVSLTDGVRTTVRLSPSSITSSNKDYAEEWHLAVTFDLGEFEDTATEKLVHAQLELLHEKMVDHEGKTFALDKKLEKDGLPIYVFEQIDEEQLIIEETKEVKQAMEETEVLQEAEHHEVSDVSTEVSGLEQEVQEAVPVATEPVECLCAHGKCDEGKSTCNGYFCESGWSGPNCDTPDSRNDDAPIVHAEQQKDVTPDGVYRPQAEGDELKTIHEEDKIHAEAVKVEKELAEEEKKEQLAEKKREESEGHHQEDRGQKQRDDRKKRREEAEAMPTHSSHYKSQESDQGVHHAKRIDDEPHQTEHSSNAHPSPEVSLHQSGQPGEEKAANRSFTTTVLGGVALIVGVCYLLAQRGVKLSLPAGSAPKYGRIQRDRANDSDGEEEGDDPAARRKMLELSEFGGQKQTGPQSRKSKGRSGVAPSAPSAQWSEEPSSTQYPGQSFNDPSSAGGYDDQAAQQLQRELELFAQEDDEEGALITTDDQPQQQWHQGDQEDDLQEYENYFDQR